MSNKKHFQGLSNNKKVCAQEEDVRSYYTLCLLASLVSWLESISISACMAFHKYTLMSSKLSLTHNRFCSCKHAKYRMRRLSFWSVIYSQPLSLFFQIPTQFVSCTSCVHFIHATFHNFPRVLLSSYTLYSFIHTIFSLSYLYVINTRKTCHATLSCSFYKLHYNYIYFPPYTNLESH